MRLSDTAIKNPVFAWMLMAGLILFGWIGFTGIGKSQLPDVDFPVIMVSTRWEGASPEVIETDVVDLIEAGELPLALETLCTQIHEYDVDLRREERDGLGILGGELGVSVAYLLGDPWATKGGDECG